VLYKRKYIPNLSVNEGKATISCEYNYPVKSMLFIIRFDLLRVHHGSRFGWGKFKSARTNTFSLPYPFPPSLPAWFSFNSCPGPSLASFWNYSTSLFHFFLLSRIFFIASSVLSLTACSFLLMSTTSSVNLNVSVTICVNASLWNSASFASLRL